MVVAFAFVTLSVFSLPNIASTEISSNVSKSIFFDEAPDNSIVKRDENHEKSQRILREYQNSKQTKYNSDNLRILTKEDFIDLNDLTDESLIQARKEIQAGNVVVVDSVVGDGTRLRRPPAPPPPGGKGAVVLGEGITFLEAKIIRLAVESDAVGAMIPEVLWCSKENLEATTQAVRNLDRKILSLPSLDPELKTAVRKYLRSKSINLMIKSELTPVVREDGTLFMGKMRNLGAGEMVPTLFDSQMAQKLGFNENTKVIFSNIDFDVDYLKAIAGAIQAKNPDLLQIHVPLQAVGGSAYWVNENGKWKITPLEWMEVPQDVLDQVVSHNTNTMVLQGRALNPDFYKELPIPFEKKIYNNETLYLPKVSLADIGKHPEITTAVAMGNTEDWFFTGSKNLDALIAQGESEIKKRIHAWKKKINVKNKAEISNNCQALIKLFF